MSKSNRGPGSSTAGHTHLPPALSSLLGPGPRVDLPHEQPESATVGATAYGVRKVEHGWETVRYTILPDGVRVEVVHQPEPHPAPAYQYAARAVHEEYARKSAGLEKL